MVAEVKEQVWVWFSRDGKDGGVDISTGIVDAFGEEGRNFVGSVAAGKKAIPKILEAYFYVGRVGTEGIDSENHTRDQATEDAWGVGGLRWQLQV